MPESDRALRQRLAFQILHDQEVGAVLLANIEDRADVWMAEGRDGLRFTLEPLFEIRISGDVLGQDFDGNGAIQAGVTGFVNFPHSSSPKCGLNLVRAELRAGLE